MTKTHVLSPPILIRMQYFYMNEVFYYSELFLTKLSIIFFLLRLFPTRAVRLVLWGSVILTSTIIMVFLLLVILQCRPLDFYWNGWEGEAKGSCLSNNAVAWSNAAFSIALDLWLLAVPLVQLRKIQLHWKKKVGVALMFSAGSLWVPLFSRSIRTRLTRYLWSMTAISIVRLRTLVKFATSPNITCR